MADPTPAQLAKAREIAVKVRERAIDFSLGTDLGRHLLSDDAALTAIARALADEAQQAEQYFVGEVAVLLVGCGINGGGPILVGIRELARNYQKMQQAMLTHGSRLADAEQRGRQAGLREALVSLRREFEAWRDVEVRERPDHPAVDVLRVALNAIDAQLAAARLWDALRQSVPVEKGPSR